ncbi:MAG: hypothetical protein JOZ41_16895 [Chloroflexi bacterium]|nr:hypothetical protein [Chloroflexota bacterium]
MRDIEQLQAGRGLARHPYPQSIGMVADGSVQSEDLEDFMRAHWKPDWESESC